MTESNSAEQLINALMANHPKGYDLSLERITGLLDSLGNPQDKIPPTLHFAGTNGKGSTIAFTRAILEAAGLSVHVHTSPHLVNWHERYRIGKKGKPGQLVSDEMLADAIDRVTMANGGQPITVFEVMTAVGFILFSEQPADVCLIEVGLGGRFDSTNVMQETAVSVITPVSVDHQAFLGDTVGKIAFEKAGIIKLNTPVVIGPQEDEALDVIEKQASRNRAPVFVSGQDFSAFEENGRMVWQDETCLLDLDLPRLPGAHQISNAATAICASRIFCAGQNPDLTAAVINEGVQSAQWPGRMQSLVEGALVDMAPAGSEIWIDGGHNPGAARIVAEFLDRLDSGRSRPLVLICAMLETKDPTGYLAPLSRLVDEIIVVPVQSSDGGIKPENLLEIANKCGISGKVASSIRDGLETIDPATSPRILICGSLYLVGEALAENKTPPV